MAVNKKKFDFIFTFIGCTILTIGICAGIVFLCFVENPFDIRSFKDILILLFKICLLSLCYYTVRLLIKYYNLKTSAVKAFFILTIFCTIILAICYFLYKGSLLLALSTFFSAVAMRVYQVYLNIPENEEIQ